jgi:hypothetical protein
MAAINFPSAPSIGTTYSQNGKEWIFDGVAWKSVSRIILDSQVSGTLATNNGGTGLTSVGSANTLLGVVGAGTTLEYKSLSAGSGITITYSAGDISLAVTNAGVIAGSGTTGTIPLFDSTSSITDSLITQSGTMVQIAGSFKALTKSFKIPHPLDPVNKILEHGSLEGPEHGAYQRGTSEGIGDVKVDLPDYWSALVEPDYNIILTSRGNYNLYIKEQNYNYFIVSKINHSVNNIESTTKFDYLCLGERKDFKIQVIQYKK